MRDGKKSSRHQQLARAASFNFVFYDFSFHCNIVTNQWNQRNGKNWRSIVADNLKIKTGDVLKDAVSDIGGVVSNVTHTVIPDCIFGVRSVSIVLYTRWFLFLRANILLQKGECIFYVYVIRIFEYLWCLRVD